MTGFRTCLLMPLLGMTLGAATPSPKGHVPVDAWLRRAGPDPKGNRPSFDLQVLTLDELQTYDIQYERDSVRGGNRAPYKPSYEVK